MGERSSGLETAQDWGGGLGSERSPQKRGVERGGGEIQVGERTQTGRALGNIKGTWIWGSIPGLPGNAETIPRWGGGRTGGGSQKWGGDTGNQG